MADRAVIESVQRYLKRLGDEGFATSFAVVFGSHARGDCHEWSDIDLLVVSTRFDGEIRREDVSRLWRVAARTDSGIEPIPCGERQWDEDASTSVIEIARREGSRVTPAA